MARSPDDPIKTSFRIDRCDTLAGRAATLVYNLD